MAKLKKKPIFNWKLKFVALTHFRHGANRLVKPGEDFSAKPHILINHFRNNRIGPVGNEWTEQMIELNKKGKPGRPRKDDPKNSVEKEVEVVETETTETETTETKDTESGLKIERQGKRFIVGERVFYKKETLIAHLKEEKLLDLVKEAENF